MGANLLLLSTARGAGIAVNSKTKQETFMKMISAGAGLGVGVKDYRVVFAFETEKAWLNFLDSGWDGSAQSDAAAKTSGLAEHSPERLRSHRMCGSIKSPRRASLFN
jgi:lipid-binding SYLF domain-containing protein